MPHSIVQELPVVECCSLDEISNKAAPRAVLFQIFAYMDLNFEDISYDPTFLINLNSP
jgi:hypothetical protein